MALVMETTLTLMMMEHNISQSLFFGPLETTKLPLNYVIIISGGDFPSMKTK